VATASQRDASDAGKVPSEPSLIGIALRRWWLVALCVVLGAAAAGGYSATKQKLYTASAKVLFREATQPEQSVQSVLGLPAPSVSQDPAQQAATNSALVSLGTVADLTARALGDATSASEVASEVSVAEVGQSNIATVTATDPSPAKAATLANTYASQIVVFRKNLNRSVVESAIRDVQNQLRKLPQGDASRPARQTLRSQLDRLTALAGSQTGDVQVVQTATIPSAPSSPRTKLNIGVGAVLGLILGVLLALLMHRVSRRVESPTELADAYGLPVLGVVPRTRELAVSNRRRGQHRLRLAPASRTPGRNGASPGSHPSLPAPAANAFRDVRTVLRYAHPDRDVRSVLVTSAHRGEGKSTVAWQLARVVAIQRNRRVLVLECDLRRPTLARAHGLRVAPGLVEVLGGKVALSGAVQTVDPNPDEAHLDFVNLDDLSLDRIGRVDSDDRSTEEGASPQSQLHVLVAGSPTSNPADLLDSDQMSTLLRDLAAAYDFIVLDAPPGPLVSDTFPLVSQADGVIIVSSPRHASWDGFNTLRSQLELLDAPILGVVVNNAKRGGAEDYYPYTPGALAGTTASGQSGTGRTGSADEVRDAPPGTPI